MENYIVINGKKAELTEEQLKKLGIKPDMSAHKEMFHQELHSYYYFINAKGDVGCFTDEREPDDEMYYSVGNYCKDRTAMKQRALHETLNRLLWRASVIAGELDNEWNANNIHYFICYNAESASWGLYNYEISKVPGVCYFPTRDSAENAIENIVKPFMKEHPEFKW